jgi:hypothetical protein
MAATSSGLPKRPSGNARLEIRGRGAQLEPAAGHRAGEIALTRIPCGAKRPCELLHQHRLPALRRAVVRQVARRVGVQRRQETACVRGSPAPACAGRAPARSGNLRSGLTSSISRHTASLAFENGIGFVAPRARRVHKDGDALELTDRPRGEPLCFSCYRKIASRRDPTR